MAADTQWDQVLDDEWAHHAQRRRAVNATAASAGDEAAPDHRPCSDARPPAAQAELLGLCFSGGGIRSSTFNLGIAQALARFGVFRHVDILSTVSGGGFVGTAITSALARPAEGAPLTEFPFDRNPDRPEGPLSRHLRERASYLNGRGTRDWLRSGARLARGVALNMLVLLPLPLLMAAAAAALWGGDRGLAPAQPWVALTMGAGVALWVLLAPLWLRRKTLAERDRRERGFVVLLVGWLAVVAVEAQPHVLAWSHEAMAGRLEWGVGASGLLGLLASKQAGRFAGLASQAHRLVATVGLAAAGLALPVAIYLFTAEQLVFQGWPLWPVLLTAGGVWLLVALLYDANAASMHGLYRDRLSETFVVAPGADDGVVIRDGLRLTETGGDGSLAPYHLVNATVNLQASADRRLRGRRADFFTFGRAWSGGGATGWCRTAQLEAADPALTAAAAMAISGAAAAPNMGSYTSPPLVMLMTVLNVRTGVWAPNPRWLQRARRPRRPGPRALLREMTSRIDAEGPLVNLTDGAHLENLGLYPALQRRCRALIVGDGEADPQRAFAGLTDAIRYAEIDLGVEIQIDLDPLRPDAEGVSRRNWAVGTVRYPARGDAPALEGYLLYLKLGLTGRETQAVRGYAARHPAFPHQPTSDQFFDEAQFEAYRALGDGLVTELMEDTGRPPGPASARAALRWIRELVSWQTDAGGRVLPAALTDVDDAYYLQIFPAAEGDVAGHRAVGQQLRALEALLADVPIRSSAARRSPRFEGVLNQLEVLAGTQTFRRHYRSHLPHLSAATIHFCDAVLGLTLGVAWAPTAPEALAARGCIALAASDGRWYRGEPTIDGQPSAAPTPPDAPPSLWARVEIADGTARIGRLEVQPQLGTVLLVDRAVSALLDLLDRLAQEHRQGGLTRDQGTGPVAFSPDFGDAEDGFQTVERDVADALPAHLRQAWLDAQGRA